MAMDGDCLLALYDHTSGTVETLDLSGLDPLHAISLVVAEVPLLEETLLRGYRTFYQELMRIHPLVGADPVLTHNALDGLTTLLERYEHGLGVQLQIESVTLPIHREMLISAYFADLEYNADWQSACLGWEANLHTVILRQERRP
jgi:hypothetical protein